MPKISIIVPVYKVEPYLDRCISSILDQTFTDFELILVDDGSPDRCGEMCDYWAGKDERIHVTMSDLFLEDKKKFTKTCKRVLRKNLWCYLKITLINKGIIKEAWIVAYPWLQIVYTVLSHISKDNKMYFKYQS